MSKPPIFDNFTLPCPWGPYRAVVIQVYDGDTPRFWFSLGVDHYAWVDIRLRDVRAPEMHDRDPVVRAQAVESRDYLASLLAPIGYKQVKLHTERVAGAAEEATFDRFVGVIEDGRGKGWVNAEMRRWLEEKGYTGGM